MTLNTNSKNQAIVYGSMFIIMLLAIVARFSTSLPNFAPFGALALFAGAFITNRKIAFVFPLAGLFIGDLLMEFNKSGSGFYPDMVFVYASYMICIVLGFSMKNKNWYNVLGLSFASSLVFFIVSNFGVWAMTNMYPHTLTGLVSCYTLAVPFIKNTIISDLAFNTILFGSAAILFSKKATIVQA